MGSGGEATRKSSIKMNGRAGVSLSEGTCKTGKAMKEEISLRIRVPEIDLDMILDRIKHYQRART